MRHFPRISASFVVTPLLAFFATACGSDDPKGDGNAVAIGFNDAAMADLRASGIDKYVGQFTPSGNSTTDNVTTYEFDSANGGPICLWGSSFRAGIRDTGSDDLVIYLQGGGACRTGLCAANVDAAPGVPTAGVLNPAATNVVGSWNVVYVPYCDGSTFSGDNELPGVGPSGETRHHRGVRNLTAALDLAKAHFPNPRRIVLAGSSAGGYGTIMGTALMRFVYPKTPLSVFSDSGVVLTAEDPSIIAEMVSEWKLDQFFPSSCTDCSANNIANVVAWGLRNDPSLRAAAFSSYADSVLALFFSLPAGSTTFKNTLLAQSGAVHDEFPDRFKRLFVAGEQHTTLITDGDYAAARDGIVVSDWTRAFVDDTADWVDHLQP